MNPIPIENANRKLIKGHLIHQNYVSRFDGTRFKYEPSSKFPHYRVLALGSYRNSPFVTGGYGTLKTEILDYKGKKWNQAEDYPFSKSDR